MRWRVFIFGLIYIMVIYGWMAFKSKGWWAPFEDWGNQVYDDYNGSATRVSWQVWRLGELSEIALLRLVIVLLVFASYLDRFRLAIGVVASVMFVIGVWDVVQQSIYSSNRAFAGIEFLFIVVLLGLFIWTAFYSPTAKGMEKAKLAAHSHALVINDQNGFGRFLNRLFGKRTNVYSYNKLIGDIKAVEAESKVQRMINKDQEARAAEIEENFYLMETGAVALKAALQAYETTGDEQYLQQAKESGETIKQAKDYLVNQYYGTDSSNNQDG